MKNTSSSQNSRWIILGFLLPLIYWIYLFFNSSMEVKFDSISYESLGKLIFEQGWIPYFTTGPNREPLYPLMIATSMKLGAIFSLNYQKVLTVIQILFLFSTQILSLKILDRLQVKTFAKTLCLIYIGFSPALVNSAFSLFSEIAAYPLVLGSTLLCHQAITTLHRQTILTSIRRGIGLGLVFLSLVSVKGVFELVSPFILGYTVFLLLFSQYPYPRKYSYIFIFALAALLTLYIPIHLYKSVNLKYNHQYTLTDRGNWMLYGAVAKRTSPEAKGKLPVALAFSAGNNFCTKFFSEKDCDYWYFETSDYYGMTKLQELSAQGLNSEEINKRLLSISKDLINNNPQQYFLATFIESLKFAFWESTKIGFVNYPTRLEALFNNKIFKDGLRFTVSFLTFLSLLYSLFYLLHSRRNIFNQKISDNPPTMISLILLLIIIYAGLYSLFSILTRYILPIAPLYLILIAFAFQQLLISKKSN